MQEYPASSPDTAAVCGSYITGGSLRGRKLLLTAHASQLERGEQGVLAATRDMTGAIAYTQNMALSFTTSPARSNVWPMRREQPTQHWHVASAGDLESDNRARNKLACHRGTSLGPAEASTRGWSTNGGCWEWQRLPSKNAGLANELGSVVPLW